MIMSGWLDPAPIFRGAEWLLSLLVEASAKSAVVLAAAALAALALRRGPAAWRHLTWTVAVTGALALPVISALLPAWRVPMAMSRPHVLGLAVLSEDLLGSKPDADVPDEPDAPPAGEIALRGQSTAGPADALAREGAPLVAARLFSPRVLESAEVPMNHPDFSAARPTLWALGAWSVGFALSGVPVILGMLSLRKVALRSRPVTDEALLRLTVALAARIGLRRSVRLVLSNRREIPMTWGVFRPVVLLPADAAEWPEERLTMALLHELAHVKRWDCLTQLVARAASAVYWFNPLAWLALARVRGAQEQAVDDLALGCGLDPHAYADHLLAIVAGRASGRLCSAVALAMSATSMLERRLLGIIDEGRSRRAPGRWTIGLVAVVAMALLLPLAALRPLAGAELLPPQTVVPGPAPQGQESAKAGPAETVEAEVLAKVRELYVKPPDEAVLRNGAIKGILDALHDPYSSFLSTQQLAEIDGQLQGKFTGIGAQIELRDGNVTVITPLPDSPAFKAGLRPGDVIEAVDDQPIRGLEISAVVRRILGKAGEVVRLTVKRADRPAEVLTVTRGVVTVRSVHGFRPGSADEGRDAFLDRDHAIGYVRVAQFSNDTPGELKAMIGRLNDQGLKGLILDLRGCPGGLLSAAVEVTQMFLSQGTIVTIRGRDQAAKPISADGLAIAPDVPLVVLVDGTTASAGEIVAGALKDHDRALIVGSRTVGKGSVQSLVKLKDGSGALRLTSAYYQLPHGEEIDKQEGKTSWGVDPTDGYYVPVDRKTLEAMMRKRVERQRVGGPDLAGAAAAEVKVTPESIERDHADPQLAAALMTLIARTTRGEFAKVGLPVSEQSARIQRLDEARKRREALLEDLKKVDKELGELDGVSADRP
jgi:carboxyl-terminal processing protease